MGRGIKDSDIEKESSEIYKEYECQGRRGNVYTEKNHQKLQETKILPILEGKPLARSHSKSLPEGRVTQNWLWRILPPPAQQQFTWVTSSLTQRTRDPLQAWAAVGSLGLQTQGPFPNPDSSISYHIPVARIKQSLYKALVQKEHSQNPHNCMLYPLLITLQLSSPSELIYDQLINSPGSLSYFEGRSCSLALWLPAVTDPLHLDSVTQGWKLPSATSVLYAWKCLPAFPISPVLGTVSPVDYWENRGIHAWNFLSQTRPQEPEREKTKLNTKLKCYSKAGGGLYSPGGMGHSGHPGSKVSSAQQQLAHAKKLQKQRGNDIKHWNHIPVPCEASWIRLQTLPHSMSQESSSLTSHSTHRQDHGSRQTSCSRDTQQKKPFLAGGRQGSPGCQRNLWH